MMALAFEDITDPRMRVIIDNTETLLKEGQHEAVLSLMVSIVIGAVMNSGASELELKEYLVHCVTRCYDSLPKSRDSIH